MKIIIIDKIMEELKSAQQTPLYGLQEGGTIIVSSLEKKKGLPAIGHFQLQKANAPSLKNKLFFHLENGELKCAIISKDGALTSTEFEVVNYQTDFNKRNKGIIDGSVLQATTVTIVGLGSGGASIASELVRCGVTNLNLIEFDTISISNLCRSPYNLPDIGKKKTEIMHEKLLRINPCINIELYDENILEMEIKKFEGIIEPSDLIIDATDSPQTKILINGMIHKKKAALYPAVYENGKGGDILLTLPGLPCYECVFNSIIDQMPNSNKREWDYTTGQAKPMPALISDIQIVISRTVKIALAILTAGTKNDFFGKITEPGCTLLRINNERNDLVQNKTFHEEWVGTKINPDCMCQTLK